MGAVTSWSPRIDQVNRHVPAVDQHDIETDVAIRQVGAAGPHVFGGTHQTALLARRYRQRRVVQRTPGLDLNDHQCAAAAGQNVDLADRCAQVAGKQCISAQTQ